MLGLSSREKKVTVAYHLPEWLVRSIEELAVRRGTNKSYEAGKVIQAGLEADPEVPARVIPVANDTESAA